VPTPHPWRTPQPSLKEISTSGPSLDRKFRKLAEPGKHARLSPALFALSTNDLCMAPCPDQGYAAADVSKNGRPKTIHTRYPPGRRASPRRQPPPVLREEPLIDTAIAGW
jgi:hypothetical protein